MLQHDLRWRAPDGSSLETSAVLVTARMPSVTEPITHCPGPSRSPTVPVRSPTVPVHTVGRLYSIRAPIHPPHVAYTTHKWRLVFVVWQCVQLNLTSPQWAQHAQQCTTLYSTWWTFTVARVYTGLYARQACMPLSYALPYATECVADALYHIVLILPLDVWNVAAIIIILTIHCLSHSWGVCTLAI